MEYDLTPTQEEVDAVFEDLWQTIFRVTEEELPVEYCDDVCSCGGYHASIGTCPNSASGTHGGYTCDLCCYRQCPGHPYDNGYDDWGTDHCNPGCEARCSGFNYCQGHRILGVTINMEGIYELTYKYFTNPIDKLANLAVRTPEQEMQLAELKSNFELCLEFLSEVQSAYSGGLTMADLNGIIFLESSRVGNQAIVDIALSQVGQSGGFPYWSWYGFGSRVEWCACFVSWCANQTGQISSGALTKFAYTPNGVNWFKGNGIWASGSHTDLAPGDIIFFSWASDGRVNHVGIVIGTDGTNVYTVEGNSGDVCRIRSYPLNSSVILGYGLPNY